MTSIDAAQKCKHYDREEIDFYMVLTRESYKFTICLSCGLWLERIGATTAAVEEDALPIRERLQITRAISLYNSILRMRAKYPESHEWTQPILETLDYVMFGHDNEWIVDHFPDLKASGKKEEHKK